MGKNFSVGNRGATPQAFGSALLLACAYWGIATGTAMWQTNAAIPDVILPQGGELLERLLFAALFAVVGAIAASALRRVHSIEANAKEKLADSEKKYKALLASSLDPVVVLGKDAHVLELSDSAAALFGCSARAMIGTAIDNLVEVEAGMNPRLGTQFSNHLCGTDDRWQAPIAVRVHGVHGRRFPAEVRFIKMPRSGDRAYTLAVRETTSTVVAQKSLRSSERLFRALFDNIPDGIYRGLRNGRLLAANPALQQMLGYDSVSELLASANSRDFFCDQLEREKLMARLEQVGEARNFEIHLKRRDGSKFLALANITVVNDEGDEGVVYEGTLTDISDLLDARNALHDSEEHFRVLCDYAPYVINVINTEGEITYSSPSSANLSRRSPAEQIGLKLFRSVHPDDLPEVSKLIEEGFARPGTAKRFTCRVFRKNGSLHYIEAVGTAFMTRKGDLRAVVHSRDVTEQVRIKQQLRDLQAVKSPDATAA